MQAAPGMMQAAASPALVLQMPSWARTESCRRRVVQRGGHKTSASALLEMGNGKEQSCPWDRRNQAPHKQEPILLFGFPCTSPGASLF